MKLSSLIFIFLNLFIFQAQAAVSYSFGGVSSDPDVTGTAVKIYAGWANPQAVSSSCTSASDTCDTCSGSTRRACNLRSIHSALYLTISVSSSTSGISGLSVKGIVDTDTNIGGVLSNVATSSGYTFKIKWIDLCTALYGVSCDSATLTDGPQSAKSFKFGPAKADGTLVETTSVELYLNVYKNATASSYTPCTVNDDGTINDGDSSAADLACGYAMFPGDEKAYIDEFGSDWGGDTPAFSGMPLDSVIFLNKAYSSAVSTTIDSIGLGDISNAYQVKIKSDVTDPLEEYRLTDLPNDAKVCFIMATMDRSGTIQKFTPAYADLSASMKTYISANACITPSQVAGVLKDKNCFIATAAFGSRMDPHVQRFRDFRNEFLSNNLFGKKFIKFYYSFGPKAADYIRGSESLKTLTRAFLWPLLFVVEISLKWGLLAALASLVLLSTMIVYLYKKSDGILGALVNLRRSNWKFKKISGKWSVFFIAVFLVFAMTSNSKAQGTDEFDEFDVINEESAPAPQAPSEQKTKQEASQEAQIPGLEESVTTTQPAPGNPAAKKSDVSNSSSEPKDETPNEPPFVKSEEEVQADKISAAATSEETLKAPPIVDGKSKRIQHPNAAKGLYMIDRTTGTYYYKTKVESKKDTALSFRVGQYQTPDISSTVNGSTIKFTDVYPSELMMLMADYEWHALKGFGKLGLQFGTGLLLAQGNGFLATTSPPAGCQVPCPAKEEYTFLAIPLNVGAIYRFEYSERQWLAPFIAGGGTYYGLAEIRDDGNDTKLVGSPAAYGAAGAMVNLSALDKDTGFIFDREYGISNFWLTFEYRIVKSLNEDLDMSSDTLSLGITVDY